MRPESPPSGPGRGPGGSRWDRIVAIVGVRVVRWPGGSHAGRQVRQGTGRDQVAVRQSGRPGGGGGPRCVRPESPPGTDPPAWMEDSRCVRPGSPPGGPPGGGAGTCGLRAPPATRPVRYGWSGGQLGRDVWPSSPSCGWPIARFGVAWMERWAAGQGREAFEPLLRLAHRKVGGGRGLGIVCEAGEPPVRLGVRRVPEG